MAGRADPAAAVPEPELAQERDQGASIPAVWKRARALVPAQEQVQELAPEQEQEQALVQAPAAESTPRRPAASRMPCRNLAKRKCTACCGCSRSSAKRRTAEPRAAHRPI